jgi:hypothetical protein
MNPAKAFYPLLRGGDGAPFKKMEWNAPREMESFVHNLSTGRSAGFMFKIAASNSDGGT